MSTLTRGEAIDLINDAEVLGGEALAVLLALYKTWVGHDEIIHPDDQNQSFEWKVEHVAGFMADYIVECCMAVDGDDIRSHGPKDSDDTGIPS